MPLTVLPGALAQQSALLESVPADIGVGNWCCGGLRHGPHELTNAGFPAGRDERCRRTRESRTERRARPPSAFDARPGETRHPGSAALGFPAYRSLVRYWHVLDPVLKGWLADGIESLREITRDDVKRAIATRKGTSARSIHIVLRNVFRALRQEGVIFRDPTRGLVFAGINRTPPSVPSDRLAGVLSHAQDDFQRFVMVLVCVHALSGTDIRHLLLTDLDLSRERLIVRRPGKRHIIFLDELTYRCASGWLRERHRRWPVTTNPHLLINRWTAVDTTHSPIGTAFTAIFRATGLTMPTLRQDRIRDEAFAVDDPLHLMRLFGISSQTAMRYITAAHPERTTKLPR